MGMKHRVRARGRWNAARGDGLSAQLLGGVALTALLVAVPGQASAGPDGCSLDNDALTCAGDQSDGVDVGLGGADFDTTDTPVGTLRIEQLTGDIAPGGPRVGIGFASDSGLELISDTGEFIIDTSTGSGNGIEVSFGGSATLTHAGDIEAGGSGVSAYGPGDVSVTSRGQVSAGLGGGSQAGFSLTGFESVTLDHLGDIDVAGAGGFGVFAFGSSISLTTEGSISVAGENSLGIWAMGLFSDDDSIEINHFGDVTAVGGISATGGGRIAINSTGDVTATGASGTTSAIFAGGADIRIASRGTLDAGASTAGYGIRAEAASDAEGPTTARISQFGDIFAGSDGISVGGFDQVWIELEGSIESGNHGIDASGGQDVSIDHVGNIAAAGTGIWAIAGDGATPPQDVSLISRSAGSIRAMTGILGSSEGSLDIRHDGDLVADVWAVYATSRGSASITLDGVVESLNPSLATLMLAGFDTTYDRDAERRIVNYGTLRHGAGLDGAVIAAANEGLLVEIENHGLVAGGIGIGGAGSSAHFANHAGARFDMGPAIDLGVDGLLRNSGALSPAGWGTVGTSQLTGDLDQTTSGTLAIDIDGASSDLLAVTGSADLAGRVALAFGAMPAVPQSYTILKTTEGIGTQGLSVANPLVRWAIAYPNDEDVELTISGFDFSPEGLAGNAAWIGQHLEDAFENGGGDLDGLLGSLVAMDDLGAVQAAYATFAPEPQLASGLAAMFSSLDFSDQLMSCRVLPGGAVVVGEGQCLWARATGRLTEVDRADVGYEEFSAGISGGAQVALTETLRAGFGLGVEAANIDTALGRSEGERAHAGVALKYVSGGLTLAAAASGGMGWMDSDRRAFNGAGLDTLTSDQEIGFATGRLRAAYAFGGARFHVTPQLDLAATHVHVDGFTETGGAAALATSGTGSTVLSASPAVEIGAMVDAGGFLYRPHVKAGVTWFDDPAVTIDGRFAGSPAGVDPFTVRAQGDEVVADISAGLDIQGSGGFGVHVGYDGRFGETVESHGGTMKLQMAF